MANKNDEILSNELHSFNLVTECEAVGTDDPLLNVDVDRTSSQLAPYTFPLH